MLLTMLLLAGLTAPATPVTQAPAAYPLRFHVAPNAAGEPVVDAAWIAAQLKSARTIFGARGIDFAHAGQVPLPAANADADTRRDRNALGAFLQPDVINVFIVRRLRDIHDPKVWRQGVHWRPFGRTRGPKGFVRHLVIVSAQAGETVLAHELGHFFGHPRHSQVRGNLMSYKRRDTIPVLSARQGRLMRQWGRRFVRQKELKPVAVPRTPAAPTR